MERHVKILAMLNIVWGALGVIGAVVLVMIFGGVMGILGATAEHQVEARAAIPIIGTVAGVLLIIILIASIPSIVAGIGLLQFEPWARILGIVVSALHLFNIPFGTALGIYGLWTLLSREGQFLFERHRPPVRI